MEVNREVILADFQACTDIEDVAEAILYLERSNWDLLAAINRVMPINTQHLPSEAGNDVVMIEEVQGPRNSDSPEITCVSRTINTSTSMEIDESLPGTSRPKPVPPPRVLTFHITHDKTVHKILSLESCTLGDLKLSIWEKTNVGPCQQVLHGWHKEPPRDTTILQTLDLPRENNLQLTQLIDLGDSHSEAINLTDQLSRTYTLNVRNEMNNKLYKLKFPGTRTILEIKRDIYSLTDVHVRNQVWKGWPASVTDDDVTLGQSGIAYPEHDLSVSKIPTCDSKKEVVDLADTDSSVGEVESADDLEDTPESCHVEDDIFIDNIQSTRIQHLMPENVDDETVGTLHFAEEFEKRYGTSHPQFFTGTLEEAIQEACGKPPKDRKMLAVYLHHDNSVLAHVFCTQLLGFETVIQLLTNNFVIWGWDFTHESNEMKFLASVNQALGPTAARTVRNIDVDTMPVLMIIMRTRSNTEIFRIVHGNVGVSELLTNLIHAVDVFQEQRQADIEFEEERQARERVKQEQDKAYQESLAVDRAKEEAKQMHEQMEKQKKEQAESERLAVEAKKEAHRQSVKSSLPPEPEGNQVLKVRVRLPSGEVLERRFQPETPLQILLNYLIVEGYPTDEYKVLSTWPRRDLTSMDTTLTLKDLNFCAQETVVLEMR
ncbi:FAS-associated factor 1 [Belonocnema kinseyi]|uniref:FAS-associated factor 1 n=1 Tax=Belonocnema kinseyi TaxID=2817044 RepID=UPI00143DDD2C|nr:FAS-associated factor 1 [Belonocnema kinseyi]XP_033213037.1 FAS-associated factor 1 [Belonocnema kinseyi]